MQDTQAHLRAWMTAEFARKGRGAKRELARILGVHESAISKILNGEKGKGFQTIDLAWVPAMELFFRSKAPAVTVEFTSEPRPARDPSVQPNVSAPFSVPELPPRQIPVYGVAIGGDDGRMKFNGERLDMVGCPPELRNVANAYAVYVSGESMVPSFKPGQTAWVNPNITARPGDDVVVQVAPEHEGDAPEGFIKELVRKTPSKLILKQYNPDKSIEFALDDVVSIHVVVFASRR